MSNLESTLDVNEILAQAENPVYRRTAEAKVLLRQDLVTKHAELDAALKAALETDVLTNEPNRAPGLAVELQELEKEIDDAKVSFGFRSIGKRAWADLLKAHPPTKEQLKARSGLDHNPETFPLAAIAASCVSPPMDIVAVKRLDAALNDAQFTPLWEACLDANIGGRADPKSILAGSIRQTNERFGTTASLSESPEASS